jgi:hypothetical protein
MYKKHTQLNKSEKRTKPISVLKPRVWLYYNYNYPNKKAIIIIKTADFRARPDTVIIISTVLKVNLTRIFA